MWFLIGPIIVSLLVASTVWLRNRWVIETFGFYGVWGRMAGLYLYRKFGLWHIGTLKEKPSQTTQIDRKHKSIIVGVLDLKQEYTN